MLPVPLPSPPPLVGEWLKLLIQVVKRPASFTPSLLPVLSTWALAHTYSKSLGLTSLQPRTKPLTGILTAYSICLTMDPHHILAPPPLPLPPASHCGEQVTSLMPRVNIATIRPWQSSLVCTLLPCRPGRKSPLGPCHKLLHIYSTFHFPNHFFS